MRELDWNPPDGGMPCKERLLTIFRFARKCPMKKQILLLCASALFFGCEDSESGKAAAKPVTEVAPGDGAVVAVPKPAEESASSSDPAARGGSAFAAIAGMQRNGYQPEEALELLLAEVEKNPTAAAEFAVTLPPGANRDSCMEAVFAEWAAINEGAALEFARRNLKGMDLTVAAAAIASVLASDSPEAAQAALSLIAEPIPRGVVVQSIVSAAVATDPGRAAQWAIAQRNPVERRAAIGALAEAWSSEDLRAAAAWIDSVLQGEEKNMAAGVLLANWSSIDPRAAVDWLASRRGALDFQSGGEVLVDGWAVVDPRAAAEWVLAEPDSGSRGAFAETLMAGWALNETSNAIDWASGLGDPELRREALVAGFGAIKEDSPAALEQWIQSHPSHAALAEAVEVRDGRDEEEE